jgi:hypothetical protein
MKGTECKLNFRWTNIAVDNNGKQIDLFSYGVQRMMASYFVQSVVYFGHLFRNMLALKEKYEGSD